MPPDHASSTALAGPRTGRCDRSIPPAAVVETREWRDNEVSVQVGPLVVMPLAVAALVLRPECAEAIVACAALGIAALRHSYVSHLRLRQN